MGSAWFVWCLSLVVLSSSEVVMTVENNTELYNASGFGYELLKQRLDQLQFSFMEMFVHVKELGELVTNNQRTIEQNQLQTHQLMHALENEVGANVSLMVGYSKQILDLQTIYANHDSIRKELLKMNSNISTRSCNHFMTSPVRSCDKIDSSGSGLFNISFNPVFSCDKIDSSQSGLFNILIETFEHPVAVLCEMQKFGGGWLVFQHRFDGSVDFYRNWTEYKNGFGKAPGEFWLGLEKIHQITKQGRYELMIELETFGGNYTYARYSDFEIGSEGEQYALKKLGSYSGTAGDKLYIDKGMKFTTLDKDNDKDNIANCAVFRKGAWWYESCSLSNLNGQHQNKYEGSSIFWSGVSAGLKFTKMMMRKK